MKSRRTLTATILAAVLLMFTAACGQDTAEPSGSSGSSTGETGNDGGNDGGGDEGTHGNGGGDGTRGNDGGDGTRGNDGGDGGDGGGNSGPSSDRPSIDELHRAILEQDTFDDFDDESARCLAELFYHSAITDEGLVAIMEDDQDYEPTPAEEGVIMNMTDDLMDCLDLDFEY